MRAIDERAGLLAECLDDLNESLIELTAVFRVKRAVLARADMKALDELLAREESVAERLFDAETRREVLAGEIAEMSGAASERLADILPALGDDAADALAETGGRLRDTMAVLVREAGIVAEICKAAMEHYDRLIRIITGAGLTGSAYTARGKAGSVACRSIVDQAF